MSEVDQAELDRKALEALVVNNADLERLEALLDRFNIFEAVGLVRQEIRHSSFLAFLLDPQASHGLGDAFAKRLLQEAIMSAPDASALVTPIELSLWDLGQMEVRREWQHIDIFLLDERNRLAVIIENKIDTNEHDDQLQRYHEAVKQQYPGYRTIGLYLTPAGDEPSHENYLPLGYGLVCEVLDSLAQSRASVSNTDLQVLVTHYTQMLRRHIVGDSEIARLCQQIYYKHKRALDLIYEHRPDLQEEIKSVIEGLIEESSDFEFRTSSGKSKIKFGVRDWYVPALHWMVWFEVWNYPDSLEIKLFVGPGDEDTRQRLFEIVRRNPEVFRGASKLGSKWSNVFSRLWLKKEMYENSDQADREKEIRKHWIEFLENDLPRIDAALKNERWIWETDEPVSD